MGIRRATRRSDASLSGLERSWEAKRVETFNAVQKAVSFLKSSNIPVTLRRISEKSSDFTCTGLRVSESTILRNANCKELYLIEAKPKRAGRSGKRVLSGQLKDSPTEAETRRMQYLLRSSKLELIALLIRTERDLKSADAANGVLREKLLLVELGDLC